MRACLLPLATCLLITIATGAGHDTAAAARTGADVWLLANFASVHIPGGSLGIAPLGVTALGVWLLFITGRSIERECWAPRERNVTIAAAVLCYLLATAVVVHFATTPRASVSAVPAALAAALLSWLAMTAGTTVPRRLWRRLPRRERAVAQAGAAAALFISAAGALIIAVSLLAHIGRAATIGSVVGGPADGLALFLLGVALLPNAVLFGSAYVAGAGFAFGAGTSVAPLSTHLGAVPAVPLLAALPGSAPGWSIVVLAVPISAGVLAGRRLRQRRGSNVERGLIAFAAGAFCAIGLAVAGWLASGSVGPGRLAVAGPPFWQLLLQTAAEVGGSAAITVLAAPTIADAARFVRRAAGQRAAA